MNSSQRRCERLRRGSGQRGRQAAVAIVAALLVGASQAAEEQQYPDAFEACTSCHSYQQNEPPLDGPPLWGIVGRRVASAEEYEYSAALRAIGGTWDRARLDRFLASPVAFAPGTKMDMGGVRNAADRAEVLDFLEAQGSQKPANAAGE